jgi:uncharacterized membrane protein
MDYNSDKGKSIAIYSYLTIIGTLIAMLNNTEPKSEFASFHIRQALGLNIAFYGLGYIVGNFDSWMVSGAFYIFFIILWGFGFIGAIQGKMSLIPLLGPLFQKVFKTL